MKRILKTFCLVLAVLFILTALAGCSRRRKGDAPIWTGEKKVVMTLGGYNVYRDFYRYLFLNTKFYFDNGDNSYWQEEGNDVTKVTDYVLDSLKATYGMFTLADKYEITLSDEDEENIDAYIESSREGYSEEEIQQTLDNSFLTEDMLRYVLEIQQLEYLVYSHIVSDTTGILKVDDDAVINAVNTEFVRATHILFTFANEEEEKTALDSANAVLEKLKNGEDFETLKEEHSDDTDLKGNTDGYYFTKGEFKNEFEDTAFSLNEGEISGVVKSDVGYHIIKRLPIEEDYVNDHFEELRTQYKTALYYKLVDEEAGKLTPEYKKEYTNIQLDSFDK